MKTLMGKWYCTIVMVLSIFSIINAQQKSTDDELKMGRSVHIETIDGNDFVGTLTYYDSISVRIKTEKLGELTIKKVDIRIIEMLQTTLIHKGVYWYENPNAGRYLFAPSAYNLRKGEGYYQNIWVFMNQVSYGFTDHFTCGLGIVPLFLFGNESSRYSPMWITPKYMFGKKDKAFRFSTGAIAFFIPFGEKEMRGTAGILYGLGTYGNRNNNLTVGLGYGFARSNGEGFWAVRPTLNISGMWRLSKRSYLVTENWFASFGEGNFVSNVNVFSGAYRFAGKNVSVDIGLFRPLFPDDNDGFYALPWLGVTLPFGKRRSH